MTDKKKDKGYRTRLCSTEQLNAVATVVKQCNGTSRVNKVEVRLHPPLSFLFLLIAAKKAIKITQPMAVVSSVGRASVTNRI